MRALPSLFGVVILTIMEVSSQQFTIPYTFHYGKALDLSPFRILVGLSLDDCRTECQGRLRCLSFNFKATFCELNEERETASIALKDRPWSVYQEKPPGPPPKVLQCGRRTCGFNEVCDYKTSSCSIKECEPYVPPENGKVLGNDFAVGRRIRTGCKHGFVSSTGSVTMQTSTCLQNGSWDIAPFQCIELTTPSPTTPLPSAPVTTTPETSTPVTTSPATSTPLTTTPVTTTTTTTTPVTSAPQLIEQWVSIVTGFSSQLSNDGYSSSKVIGLPNVYPNINSVAEAWEQEIYDANQYIEIQFVESVHVKSLDIYETYSAGGVKSINAKGEFGIWVTLWSTASVQHITTARIFTPPLLSFPTATRDFRIEVDCTGGPRAIDAVKLVGTKQLNAVSGMSTAS